MYNLAEEGHSPMKIFDHLNKRIRKSNLSSENFVKFYRNSYLIRESKVKQGYSLQGKKDFKNSELLKSSLMMTTMSQRVIFSTMI